MEPKLKTACIWGGQSLLVDRRTNVPLGIALFESALDADNFVKWAGGEDLLIHAPAVTQHELRVLWEREREWPECTSLGCHERVPHMGRCLTCENDEHFEAARAERRAVLMPAPNNPAAPVEPSAPRGPLHSSVEAV